MVFKRDLVSALNVCPECGFHHPLGGLDRLKSVLDEGSIFLLPEVVVPDDPLHFRDLRRYTDRLREARQKTGQRDAALAAQGCLRGVPVLVVAQSFEFMGGSMGMAVGETLVRAIEAALSSNCPLIIFIASGGARMQEGILSLMQMAKVTAALTLLREARLPYVVVLTNPTTGGVLASYGMLGDIHIAEPGALIGFAGQRVTAELRQKERPVDYQRSEFAYAHGTVDVIASRQEMRDVLVRLICLLKGLPNKQGNSALIPTGQRSSRGAEFGRGPANAIKCNLTDIYLQSKVQYHS